MLKEVRYIQLHKKSRVQLFKEGTSGRTALLTQHFLLQIHTLIKYDFPPVFFLATLVSWQTMCILH